jgi:glutaredoxin 3
MKVEIYGAEWCNYCKQAVRLCEAKSVEYEYIDVDESGNMKVLQERLGSPARTIPQIFVDDRFLPGGFTGLQQELAKS